MAAFPTTVPTNSDLYIAINTGVTSLTANINDSTLTIPVTSTTGFPSVGAITIDGEIIHYTSIGPTQFNADARGFDGTVANSHLNGAQVNHYIIAAHHNVLKDEIIAIAQNLSDRIGLGTTQLKAQDGTTALPSYSFASDLDTGIYSSAANNIGFAANGIQIGNFSGVGALAIGNGTVSNPAFRFLSDLDTGMYRIAENDLGFAIGGVNTLEILSNQIRAGSADGSAASPVIRFASRNSGFFTSASSTVWTAIDGVATVGVASNEFGVATDGVVSIGSSGFGFTKSYLNDGTAALPAYTFSGDTNTGLYKPGADEVSISTGGTERIRLKNLGLEIRSGRIENLDGSATAPTYSFANETGLGWYRGGAARMSLAFGTVEGAFFDGTTGVFGLKNNYNMQTNVGTAATPGYSFNGDPDTGFYNVSANVIGASSGGTLTATFGSRVIATQTGFAAPDGSASVPSIAFDNDTNTGIFRSGTDTLDITTGGTVAANWDLNVMVLNRQLRSQDGTVALPAHSFNSDPDCGLYRIGTNDIAIAVGGTKVAEYLPTTTSDGVSVVPFKLWGGSGNALLQSRHQTTANVSTSAVEIGTPGTTCSFALVTGSDGTNRWGDVLLTTVSGTGVSVIAQQTSTGSPATRTYTKSGGSLRLQMGSGTYNVNCVFLEIQL